MRYFFTLLVFLFSIALGYCQESLIKNKRLSYFEMNLSTDSRHVFKDATTYQYKDTLYNPPLKEKFDNAAYGITFRVQSSIMAINLNLREGKRFRFGDVLAAEITGGILTRKYPNTTEAWFAYKFELGFGATYQVSKNQELGLNLIFLKFASDWLAENVSGSNISMRYRFSSFVFNFGIESRGTRFMGWLSDLQEGGTTPVKYSAGIQKLILKKSSAGIQTEWISSDYYNPANQNQANNQLLFIRVSYGLYF